MKICNSNFSELLCISECKKLNSPTTQVETGPIDSTKTICSLFLIHLFTTFDPIKEVLSAHQGLFIPGGHDSLYTIGIWKRWFV